MEVFQPGGKCPKSQLELNACRVVSFRGVLRWLRNSCGMNELFFLVLGQLWLLPAPGW